MDRVWESDAIATAPALPQLPSRGHPTDGDLTTSTPPTNPGAYWFHMITEEIMAVVAAAGLTPSASALGQLLQALDHRYTPTAVDLTGVLRSTDFGGGNQLLAVNGYQRLPGGLLLQWGCQHVGDFSDGISSTNSVVFPVAFPSAVYVIPLSFMDPTTHPAEISIVLTTFDLTGFSYSLNEAGAVVEDMTAMWIAIGR